MPQPGFECNVDYSQYPEYAVAALMQMLVRYPMLDCSAMADSISIHLRFVATDERFSPVLRQVAMQSVNEWEAMITMRIEIARQQKQTN